MEPREAGIDSLLRRSMAAPVPSLPPDFERRLMRRLARRSQPLDRYSRMLFAGYGLLSALTSAAVMHSQGVGWGTIAGVILAPLALLAVARAVWRATHAQQPRNAG